MDLVHLGPYFKVALVMILESRMGILMIIVATRAVIIMFQASITIG